MPGKREAVPTAGPEAGEDMSFSFEELQAELRSLHANFYSPRQPGEWTSDEYAAANGISESTTQNILITLVAHGVVEKVSQKRFVNGRKRQMYRTVKNSDQPAAGTS